MASRKSTTHLTRRQRMLCLRTFSWECHTWGESYEHLLEMLGDAIEGWLEVASEQEAVEPEKQ